MLNGRGWALPPLALLLAFIAFNGCSSDDSSSPGPDGGGKDTGSNTDTGTPPVADSGPGTDAGEDGGPAPTFAQVYTDIISTHCLPCHATGSGFTVGMLDMSSVDAGYRNLYNVAPMGRLCSGPGVDAGDGVVARVFPGDADKSLLYKKVSSDSDDATCGAKMPKIQDGGPSLPQGMVDEIEEWINGGANP